MYLAHRRAVSAAKVFTLCAPLTLTQQTARFLVNTPEVTKLRRHVRHAVARRERVEVAPAWLVSTEDVERPSTPELVRERGVVKPADSERVRRVRRASVIHQLAKEDQKLALQEQLDGYDAPLPHGRQPRTIDIMLGFPPTYPPRVVRQGAGSGRCIGWSRVAIWLWRHSLLGGCVCVCVCVCVLAVFLAAVPGGIHRVASNSARGAAG